ncbi:MAG TPA: Zn-dependent alcohol dehydrogenase [Candidatus Binataceae bacterium]|nr:Zn-dependent alcohol dehydrogenase [Candidatus Binataceae bacterium]
MKAAVFHGAQQPLTIEEVEIDQPQDREVLVRTVASGVCHSDLHFIEGLYPYPQPAILGHEAAGVVEQVGRSVTYLQPGDHVIGCLSVFCGYCEDCMTGHPSRCSNHLATRRGKDEKPRLSQKGKPLKQFAELSTYAEQMLVHENALVKIGKDIPLDRAALVGCGVTTGMGAVLNTARIEPGSTVAVFGCGGVGLAAIQGARIAGARMIIAVDQFPNKLAMAQRLGATHTVDSSKDDPVKAIRALTSKGDTGGGMMSPSNDGVDYAFEAVGLKLLAEMCFEAIKPGGTATIIGMIPVGQKIAINGGKLLTERKLQGTNMGSNRFRIDMPRYLDYYQQGRLNLDDMISRRGRLEDVNEAFRAMKAGEVARTVLMFD